MGVAWAEALTSPCGSPSGSRMDWVSNSQLECGMGGKEFREFV